LASELRAEALEETSVFMAIRIRIFP
jgi:hypothetical protein